MDLLDKHFETVKVDLRDNYLSNRLHDKFCVINFETI